MQTIIDLFPSSISSTIRGLPPEASIVVLVLVVMFLLIWQFNKTA